MSSDDLFDDEVFDESALRQLDAIEAAHFSPGKKTVEPSVVQGSSSDGFDSFHLNEDDLAHLDNFVEDVYQGKAPSFPYANQQGLPSSSRTTASRINRAIGGQRTKSNTIESLSGRPARKTKVWDHTEFAKTGWRRGKSKAKARGSFDDDGVEVKEEPVEFKQFPAPSISGIRVSFWILAVSPFAQEPRPATNLRPPPPMKLKPDLLEAKHWIYPLNQPKRDYQFNIVKHCFFDNTLVALPTGLGKTFIAGCVMLNFYRWFPEGKVVFVAPTKPLVAQQIEACHKVCGIPGSHAVELTGQNPRAMRSRAWVEKRVFYMTPQTLLNDLTTESCDPRDIIMLVIDEAHKGTGDYAYAQVVRYLMAKSSHFRVLALTATPGATSEAVQEIVDALHISRIEIRDEGSLDLRDYIHRKNIKKHIIRMNEDVNKVKDILAKVMEAKIKPLQARGILYGTLNPIHVSAFLPQSIMRKLRPDQRSACASLAQLSSLARAMGYLVEGTMNMCYDYVQEIADETGSGHDERKASKAARFRADPTFQALLKELEAQKEHGFSPHPKMEMLKTLVIQYFGERMGDAEAEEEPTRVMVFVTFRAAVEEIVEVLNTQRPLIRATRFIGQGTDKQGKKGFAQKEQLEVIKKFRSGEFNVLVATSIGEEGLDIGEIDMIVCYDAQKTPIRMLQRLGRTGRRRDGYVHVLLAEGREELNMDKAKETYKQVQKTIISGDQLELYGDVDRLLPEHVRPECLEKVMTIEEYVRDGPKQKEARSSTSCNGPPLKKRKRNDDVSRNIPMGASSGFLSVRDLLLKSKSKAKGKGKMRETLDPDEVELSDDVDAEIEQGIETLRRAASTSGCAAKRKSTGAGQGRAKTRSTKVTKTKLAHATSEPPRLREPVSSQCVDDSDDHDIERGIVNKDVLRQRALAQPTHPSIAMPRAERQVVNLLSDSDADPEPCGWNIRKQSTPITKGRGLETHGSPSPKRIRDDDEGQDQSMAWLVDEDEDPAFELRDSSPLTPPRMRRTVISDASSEVEVIGESRRSDFPTSLGPEQGSISSRIRAFPDSRPRPAQGYDCSQEPVSSTGPRVGTNPDESPDAADGSGLVGNSSVSPSGSSTRSILGISPEAAQYNSRGSTTSPRSSPGGGTSCDYPEQSVPVRRRRRLVKAVIDSSPFKMPPPSQRRLQRLPSPPGQPTRPKKTKVTAESLKHNLWVEVEATHSGDEVSEGSSPGESSESESDRQFLRAPPETQVPPSYDQSMVYLRSLQTQAPGGAAAPVFAGQLVRRGPLGRGAGGAPYSRHRAPVLLSSPVQPDEYDLGSFVVPDDAEIEVDEPSSDV